MYKIQTYLLLTSLIFACSCKDATPWNKVKNDITSTPLTDSFIKAKFSSSAIYSLTGEHSDTTKEITAFFNNFKENKNYTIETQSDTTYVIFNSNDPIAGGPTIEIIGDIYKWNIVDIRFGK